MDRSIRQICHDLKEAFVYPSAYLERNSMEIRQKIQQKLAETNCKRILLLSPLFLGMVLFHMIGLYLRHRQSGYYISLWLSIFMLAVILAVSGLICWLLYFNQIDNEKEMWKYEVLYRVFWCIWMPVMTTLSLYRLLEGRGGIYYVFVCALFCLVPLYNVKEFIFILLLFQLIAHSGLFFLDKRHPGMEITAYTYIAMAVVGFAAQWFEMHLWTLREYVYVAAFVDSLTGLLNRRGGNAVLEEELRHKGGRLNLGVIMIDIDYFKKYNDSLGHDAGDYCLKMVAGCLKNTVWERTHMVIRHGGEEFVVALAGATEKETQECAEKLRLEVYSCGLPTPCNLIADMVTISVGASYELNVQDAHYENHLHVADEALYEAKKAGRNRVVYKRKIEGEST